MVFIRDHFSLIFLSLLQLDFKMSPLLRFVFFQSQKQVMAKPLSWEIVAKNWRNFLAFLPLECDPRGWLPTGISSSMDMSS